MKRSVWPQDLVEPQHIEGYLEESQNVYSGLCCFKGKGPDQLKTVFRTLDLVLLFHNDFKKNSYGSLCCFWVKVFRRRFIHCRSCLTLSDCGKPVRCNDSLFSEVFFDSICSSSAQPLVVEVSAGSRGIPYNTDSSFRVFFQNLDTPFQYHLCFFCKDRLIEIEMHVHTFKDNYPLLNLTTEMIIF